ncbi:unnamed protein product [Parascedosporium putredinis]|uniref:Zn(2)-C6 fungal-type domain-containing protein n=1 Tax=Parascedosporium putredinis TaxID=1442378 RepID=A0A9P1H5D1_9PEZI|nr:unnamed protein product [Parascedosporium putredinis]CAI7996797.1 unnamed protein product [Parascedosporium putredinis]
MSTQQSGSPSASKVPRMRPHSKSRKGCLECKTRRVKCDEAKPQCRNCDRRNVVCVYVAAAKRKSHLTSTAALTPAAEEVAEDTRCVGQAALPAEARLGHCCPVSLCSDQLLKLRLMHNYDSAMVDSLVGALQFNTSVSQVLRKEVPELAFKHPFLMDTLLSTSIIHLECTGFNMGPRVLEYRYNAIRNLRRELTKGQEQSLPALIAASTLLSATSLAADRVTNYQGLWITNWLAMPLGSRALLDKRRGQAHGRAQYGMPPTVHAMGHIDHGPVPVLIPESLAEALRICDENDPDVPFRVALDTAAEGIGKLFGMLLAPHLVPWIQLRVRAWPFTYGSAKFVEMVRLGRPRALVLVTYYLAFLKLLPAVWLYDGVVERDMRKIGEVLGEEWAGSIEIARASVMAENPEERVAFMKQQVMASQEADASPSSLPNLYS